MNFDWINDGRKIPDDVMYYIRVMAVNSVRVLGQKARKLSPWPITSIVRAFTAG
jgi:hypothetical protein